MFTTVSRSKIEAHRFEPGQPIPEIIDHRLTGPRDGRWSTGQPEGHKTYESIKQQLEASIASEKELKKRVKELEADNGKLLEVYEATNTENTILKSHMKHGPHAKKIKQLEKYVKDLNDELEAKKEENLLLLDRMKDLEKLGIQMKDLYVEKNWYTALEKAKKRREEKDANIGTQGPFKEGNHKKKRMKHVNEEMFESQDSRDLMIDNLEKETLILLNKIRLFKQNKEEIDYAHFIDKGALTRNKVIKDAINDKLDRDLENFANRLNALQQKALTLRIKSRGSESDHMPPISQKSPTIKTKETKQTVYTHKVKPKNTSKPSSGKSERKMSRKSNRGNKQTVQTPGEKSVTTSESNSRVTFDEETSEKRYREMNENTPLLSRASSVSSDDAVENIRNPRHTDSVPGSSVRRQQNTETSKSVTPSSIHRSGSPIENHWDNLAEKLIQTEKYGGVKSGRQQSHRDTKSVISGRPTTNSSKVNNESSNKSSNAVQNKNTKDNNNISSISTEADDSKQPKVTYNGVTRSHDKLRSFDTMQSEQIRFVSAQRGRFTNGPEPISRINDKPAKWKKTKKTKKKNNTEDEPTETNPEKYEQDVVEETRDVSAYDAILADLNKQHENQEKVLRTSRKSQQITLNKSVSDTEPYKDYDNDFNRQMYSPTRQGMGANRRQYSFSRQSTNTLDLL
ncbi:hypothetical protein ACF0H5_000331 [Mactra antiquata]